jgi:hypothetical protein
MANSIDRKAIAQITQGFRVSKAAAALPQTGASALFNVTGGRVMILGIVGEVTVAIQNQANNTKLVANPDTGTSVDICAVLNTAADEVGLKPAVLRAFVAGDAAFVGGVGAVDAGGDDAHVLGGDDSGGVGIGPFFLDGAGGGLGAFFGEEDATEADEDAAAEVAALECLGGEGVEGG